MMPAALRTTSLFDIRLDAGIARIGESAIHYVDGASRALPRELAHLGTLTAAWQPQHHLLRSGFTTWQLSRLFETGIVECGRGEYVFPRRARRYFERQFGERARLRTFAEWLGSPVPGVIWIGLPHANLADLRHSTATGLAAAIDALPLSASVLGIVPELEPTARCAADMRSLAGLAHDCGFKLGILGGDHRATWSLLSALKGACGAREVRYVHIDAHHDLYGIEQTNAPRRIHHSNFLIELLERRHVDRVWLLGCRDRMAPVRFACAAGHDLTILRSPAEFTTERVPAGAHTHLSIDIDVLDPAHFKGVSSPLGGGWTLHELLEAVLDVTRAVRVDSVSIVEAGSGCANTVEAVSKLVQLLEGAL